MNLVEGVAHFGGEFVELGLHVGQRAVAQVEQAAQLAAADGFGDVIASGFAVDKDAAEVAFGIGRARGDRGSRRVGDGRRNVFHQGATARGKDNDVAIAAHEITDVDDLRQFVERGIALIGEVADIDPNSRIADNLIVEVGDGGGEFVHAPDLGGDVDVGLAAQVLDHDAHFL